jgi:general stress protein 26
MPEISKRLKEIAYKFILGNRVAHVATVDLNGKPQSSTVYCFPSKNLDIFFLSRIEGRKVKNMIFKPVVSMSVTNEDEMSTLQLTGSTEIVSSFEKEQDIFYKLIKLRGGHPDWDIPVVKMFERGDTNEIVLIKVTPGEMTLSNFTSLKNGAFKPFFQKII